MIAYHGSIIEGLEILKPFGDSNANLKYPCVYLTTNYALATIYIWNPAQTILKNFKWMTYGYNKEGMLVYNETFKNGLKEFYNGVKGFIYTCESNFETDENIGIKHTVISTKPVKIINTDIIDNVYEHILQYEKDGLLKINHFETLTPQQKQGIRNMVMRTINEYELLKKEHPALKFVQEKYPEIWEDALAASKK